MVSWYIFPVLGKKNLATLLASSFHLYFQGYCDQAAYVLQCPLFLSAVKLHNRLSHSCKQSNYRQKVYRKAKLKKIYFIFVLADKPEWSKIKDLCQQWYLKLASDALM
jgi:hypothetical protein